MKKLLGVLIITTSMACSPQHYISVGEQRDVPVMLTGGFGLTTDTAGGVDIQLRWVNTSSKTIKYIVFVVTAYNRVDDPAPCEIKNRATARLESVGPFEPGKGSMSAIPGVPGYTTWENVWYNHSIHCSKLNEIHIEYMDGEKEVIKEEQIDLVNDGLRDRSKQCGRLTSKRN